MSLFSAIADLIKPAPPPDPGRPVIVNPSLADTMADASKEAGRLVRGLFSSLFKKRG